MRTGGVWSSVFDHLTSFAGLDVCRYNAAGWVVKAFYRGVEIFSRTDDKYSMTIDSVQTTDEQSAALELLRGARRVLLTGHEAPDGDCIGAQTAMSRMLRSMGKEVWILNPDPVESKYSYLTEHCDFGVYKGADLPVHDLACLLDGGELERTGRLAAPLARAASKKIVVDHHVTTSAPWADGAFTDVKASATGLLVWRIAEALGVELDQIACEGVFTSIVTDTGWFKYSNTDAETLRVCSQLAERGVSPSELFAKIYQRRGPGYPVHVGRVLEGVVYHAEGRLAVVTVPMDDVSSGQVEMHDILDVLGSVGNVEVVLLLRETGHGQCKLSARSKTAFDVSELARRFGGGGHARASGARLKGTLVEAQADIVGAVLEALEVTL
ncbi:MAG: phosphoesterase RecJ-like protein [Chlamydiales bacterium]|jgi:phosphoesterase RecJ-like protein